MSTLLIASNTAGSAAVFRQPLIAAARAEGYAVHVLCGEGQNSPAYVEDMESRGAIVHLIRGLESDGLSPRTLRIQSRQVGKLIDAINPHIVHSFTHRANVVSYFALRQRKGIRFIPNVTGAGRLFEDNPSLVTLLKRKALLALYRAMAARCEVIFFQNATDAEEIGEVMNLPPDRIRLTNGSGLSPEGMPVVADLEVTAFRQYLLEEHGIEPDRRLFLFPARALHSKGVTQFYEAALRYLDQYDDAAFVHAGLTVEDPTIGLSAADIDAMRKPRIAYIGFRTDMPTVMSAVDALVLPSYYREGTPRALIEGLYQGKPIFTTDMPGCRETVVHGWNGYMVPPRSTDELFSALVQFRTADHQAMEANSKDLFERKYHARHIVDLYINLYKSGVNAAAP